MMTKDDVTERHEKYTSIKYSPCNNLPYDIGSVNAYSYKSVYLANYNINALPDNFPKLN